MNAAEVRTSAHLTKGPTAMPVRVPINGDTLAWARNVLGIGQEVLAKAAGIKPERLAAFENGEAQPTYNQATALAKRLDRPLAFFFVPPPNKSDVPETVAPSARIIAELLLARQRKVTNQRAEINQLRAQIERKDEALRFMGERIAGLEAKAAEREWQASNEGTGR